MALQDIDAIDNDAILFDQDANDFTAQTLVFSLAMTSTVSPCLILCMFRLPRLQSFPSASETTLHKAFVAQFARHGPEDARAPRVLKVFRQDDGPRYRQSESSSRRCGGIPCASAR